MIDKKPKTYNEIVRMKKCYTLTQYFSNITENVFNEIYNFLGENPENTIRMPDRSRFDDKCKCPTGTRFCSRTFN